MAFSGTQITGLSLIAGIRRLYGAFTGRSPVLGLNPNCPRSFEVTQPIRVMEVYQPTRTIEYDESNCV